MNIRLLDKPRVLETLLDLWGQCRHDWRFVSERLSRAFRKARYLHSAERRLIAEFLFDLVRRVRTLDTVLEAAGHPPPPPHREPTRDEAFRDLVALRVLYQDLSDGDAEALLPGISWPEVRGHFAAIDSISDPLRRFCLRHSLPDWIGRSLLETYSPADAESYATALNARAPLTLRVNTLKNDRDSLLAHLESEGLEVEKGQFSPTAFHLLNRVNVFGLQSFRDGLFEVQDEGSQLIADLVAPPVRALVIDACAGAGGKSLALGAHMNNRGRLIAMDTAAHKLKDASKRARRAGLHTMQTLQVPADGPFPKAAKGWEAKAARVLVDAPCSSLGSMRRTPAARWILDEAFVDSLPAIQLAIAQRALTLVKPGGRLIYATCTSRREENEAVVDALMQSEPRLERIAVKEILGKKRAEPITDAEGFAIKTTPFEHGMDGFYATSLRLKEE